MISDTVQEHIVEIAGHYSNLEYNIQEGTRGSRHIHVEKIITQLTGTEAAVVVNNNAAAVMLILNTVAKDKKVIVIDQMMALTTFKVKYTNEHIKVRKQLEELYYDEQFTMPSTSEVVRLFNNQQEVLQIIQSLIEEGVLIKIDMNTCLHCSNYKKALNALQEFISQNGSITVAEYRDLIGTSRKYALLILEYLIRRSNKKGRGCSII